VSRLVRWTPAAANDLQHVSDYLSESHPQYRHPTLRKVYASIQVLKDWPYPGRPGREEGTRELILSPLPYVAIYRVNDLSIEVLRIYHSGQDRP